MQDEDENVNITHEEKNGLNDNFDSNEKNSKRSRRMHKWRICSFWKLSTTTSAQFRQNATSAHLKCFA